MHLWFIIPYVIIDIILTTPVKKFYTLYLYTNVGLFNIFILSYDADKDRFDALLIF